MWSDDGIVIRLPEAADDLPVDELLIDPEDIDELVVSTLPQTSLFSARFRECAARALLLPRRRPTPAPRCGSSASGPPTCWRWRPSTRASPSSWRPAGSACRTCSTSRRCARCWASCGAGRCAWSASTRRRRRRSRRACCSTGSPRTCTRATRRWPSGGRRRWPSTATCCASCWAPRSCASCSTPASWPTWSWSCSASATDGGPAAPTSSTTCCAGWATCPRPSSTCAPRAPGPPRCGWPSSSPNGGPSSSASATRSGAIAAEDAARYRDALGCAIPLGLPAAFTEPVARPLEHLVGRYARTHGPFLADAPARRFGLRHGARRGAAGRAGGRGSRGAGRVPAGRRRRGSGATSRCCASSAGVRSPRCAARSNRSSRRRSPASCPAWHGIPARRRGLDALVEALGLLQGAPLVASTLEQDVLPARVLGYRGPRPRRAVHRRRPGLGGSRRPGLGRRAGAPVLPRPARRCWGRARRTRTRRTASCTPPSGTTSVGRAPRSGTSSGRRSRGHGHRAPRRPVGPGVGR